MMRVFGWLQSVPENSKLRLSDGAQARIRIILGGRFLWIKISFEKDIGHLSFPRCRRLSVRHNVILLCQERV